jgi:hypothetical protein
MYNFFFIGNKRNNINKRKGASKAYKEYTRTPKQKKNTWKNPKDRRKATLNLQPLVSNPARTYTPSTEIDQAFYAQIHIHKRSYRQIDNESNKISHRSS